MHKKIIFTALAVMGLFEYEYDRTRQRRWRNGFALSGGHGKDRGCRCGRGGPSAKRGPMRAF